MKTKLTIPQIDGESRMESSYSVTLSPKEFDAAIAKGAIGLGAFQVGRSWYYQSDETGEIYRLTDREIATYGAGRGDARGIDHSLWCSYNGVLVTRPSAAVLDALGMRCAR